MRYSKSHLFLSHVNVWRDAFQMMNKQKRGDWKRASENLQVVMGRELFLDFSCQMESHRNLSLQAPEMVAHTFYLHEISKLGTTSNDQSTA
jgi:hypothetical protein